METGVSKLVLWRVAWGSVVVAVYAAALVAFTHTSTTNGPSVGPFAAAIMAAQLFVLNSVAFPTGEGPWVVVCWVAFFTAPVTTVLSAGAAMVRFAHRHFVTPRARVKKLEGPVIVCGYGNHGRMIAAHFAPLAPIVVVDTSGSFGAEVSVLNQRVPVIEGDMADPEVLRAAGIRSARAVYFASGDPLRNLSGAVVAARLRDLGESKCSMIRPLVDDERIAKRLLAVYDPNGRVQLMAQFDKATAALLDRIPGGRLENATAITIVGFGRFGQALAREIARRAPGTGRTIQVVDLYAKAKVADVGDELEEAGWKIDAVEMDVRAWSGGSVTELPDLLFVCLDRDELNLQIAVRLIAKGEKGGRAVHAVLRIFAPPGGHADRLPDSISMVSITDLLRDKLKEEILPR